MSFNEIQFSCLLQGKYTEAGTGKSKNLAKRQAANKMIQKLRNLPMENEEDSRGRYTQEQVEVNGHNHTGEIYDGQLGDFLKEAVEIICGDVARLELEVRRQEEAGAGILARTAGLGEDIRQYRHQLADTRTQHTAWLKQSVFSFQNNRNGEK